jgi:hypothetical protein
MESDDDENVDSLIEPFASSVLVVCLLSNRGQPKLGKELQSSR